MMPTHYTGNELTWWVTESPQLLAYNIQYLFWKGKGSKQLSVNCPSSTLAFKPLQNDFKYCKLEQLEIYQISSSAVVCYQELHDI